MKLVDDKNVEPLNGMTLDEIISWMKDHEQKGNIARLTVVFEDKEENVYSRSMNTLNKDFVYMLVSELIDVYRK